MDRVHAVIVGIVCLTVLNCAIAAFYSPGRELFVTHASIPTASIRLSGGLGNRLFQLAFVYAYCTRHQLQLKIDNPGDVSAHSTKPYTYLAHRLEALDCYNVAANPTNTVTETHAQTWACVDWPCITQNTLFIGYFQNVQYFAAHAPMVRQLFSEPPDTFSAKDQPRLDRLADSAFLHIRLGDYLPNKLLFLGAEYCSQTLLEGMDKIGSSVPLKVFTDDPDKAREMFPQVFAQGEKHGMELVDEKDEIRAFYMMVRCRKGGIALNSTFAWWAAFMNDSSNKMVHFPSKWTTQNDVGPGDPKQ